MSVLPINGNHPKRQAVETATLRQVFDIKDLFFEIMSFLRLPAIYNCFSLNREMYQILKDEEHAFWELLFKAYKVFPDQFQKLKDEKELSNMEMIKRAVIVKNIFAFIIVYHKNALCLLLKAYSSQQAIVQISEKQRASDITDLKRYINHSQETLEMILSNYKIVKNFVKVRSYIEKYKEIFSKFKNYFRTIDFADLRFEGNSLRFTLTLLSSDKNKEFLKPTIVAITQNNNTKEDGTFIENAFNSPNSLELEKNFSTTNDVCYGWWEERPRFHWKDHSNKFTAFFYDALEVLLLSNKKSLFKEMFGLYVEKCGLAKIRLLGELCIRFENKGILKIVMDKLYEKTEFRGISLYKYLSNGAGVLHCEHRNKEFLMDFLLEYLKTEDLVAQLYIRDSINFNAMNILGKYSKNGKISGQLEEALRKNFPKKSIYSIFGDRLSYRFGKKLAMEQVLKELEEKKIRNFSMDFPYFDTTSSFRVLIFFYEIYNDKKKAIRSLIMLLFIKSFHPFANPEKIFFKNFPKHIETIKNILRCDLKKLYEFKDKIESRGVEDKFHFLYEPYKIIFEEKFCEMESFFNNKLTPEEFNNIFSEVSAELINEMEPEREKMFFKDIFYDSNPYLTFINHFKLIFYKVKEKEKKLIMIVNFLVETIMKDNYLREIEIDWFHPAINIVNFLLFLSENKFVKTDISSAIRKATKELLHFLLYNDYPNLDDRGDDREEPSWFLSDEIKHLEKIAPILKDELTQIFKDLEGEKREHVIARLREYPQEEYPFFNPDLYINQ